MNGPGPITSRGVAVLRGSKVFDGSDTILAGASVTFDITITGALESDNPTVSWNTAINAPLVLANVYTGVDIVQINIVNPSAADQVIGNGVIAKAQIIR